MMNEPLVFQASLRGLQLGTTQLEPYIYLNINYGCGYMFTSQSKMCLDPLCHERRT